MPAGVVSSLYMNITLSMLIYVDEYSGWILIANSCMWQRSGFDQVEIIVGVLVMLYLHKDPTIFSFSCSHALSFFRGILNKRKSSHVFTMFVHIVRSYRLKCSTKS